MDRRIIKVIEAYEFPDKVISRFQYDIFIKYKLEISDEDTYFVVDALKDFFIFGFATKKPCGMPSVLVDELWHTYILFTKEYAAFCAMIGKFVHHSPEDIGEKTEVKKRNNVKSLLRTYYLSCERELLEPGITTDLPLIFLLDAILPGEYGKIFDADYLKAQFNSMPIDELM